MKREQNIVDQYGIQTSWISFEVFILENWLILRTWTHKPIILCQLFEYFDLTYDFASKTFRSSLSFHLSAINYPFIFFYL